MKGINAITVVAYLLPFAVLVAMVIFLLQPIPSQEGAPLYLQIFLVIIISVGAILTLVNAANYSYKLWRDKFLL